MMKRSLVQTNEGAGHTFRRSLPPPVVKPTPRGDDHDLKLFVLSFTAFFICFYTMIMERGSCDAQSHARWSFCASQAETPHIATTSRSSCPVVMPA